MVAETSLESGCKLEARRLSKHYLTRDGGAFVAVSDVSLEVVRNEVLVILGPSGCGKSTLLRMMAGLDEPSEGRVFLDGAEVEGPSRKLGMVFQTYTSFPWLTVQRNVEYGMRLNGVPAAERRTRAEAYITRVHLSRFAQSYPKELSGGMKQRVAIARMLANDPEVSLMDEPFGALDAETRWHMQELLLEIIQESHMTVVLVTHDIAEALFLADRIVFMARNPGRIREIIPMDFKGGRQIRDKEDLIALPGYGEMERHILRMMREETQEEM
ncbi:MAG: ABC transporter ATP-binding protein [Pseudomonadota bacterium]